MEAGLILWFSCYGLKPSKIGCQKRKLGFFIQVGAATVTFATFNGPESCLSKWICGGAQKTSADALKAVEWMRFLVPAAKSQRFRSSPYPTGTWRQTLKITNARREWINVAA